MGVDIARPLGPFYSAEPMPSLQRRIASGVQWRPRPNRDHYRQLQLQVLSLYALGYTVEELAERFGYKRTSLRGIIDRARGRQSHTEFRLTYLETQIVATTAWAQKLSERLRVACAADCGTAKFVYAVLSSEPKELNYEPFMRTFGISEATVTRRVRIVAKALECSVGIKDVIYRIYVARRYGGFEVE